MFTPAFVMVVLAMPAMKERLTALEPLQGSWRIDWQEVNGVKTESDPDTALRVVIVGDKVSLTDRPVFRLVLDAKVEPKTLDLVIIEDQGKPRALEAIVMWDADSFTVCFTPESGVKQRPTEFSGTEGRSVIRLKRLVK